MGLHKNVFQLLYCNPKRISVSDKAHTVSIIRLNFGASWNPLWWKASNSLIIVVVQLGYARLIKSFVIQMPG